MTAKTVNGIVTRFFYNPEDRLIRVEDNEGGIIAEYGYDPFGRRLWKEVDNIRTYFMYADEGLVAEYDNTGSEIRSYGWKPGSTWGTDPLFMKVNGDYYFYHNDHLGTPQMMTKEQCDDDFYNCMVNKCKRNAVNVKECIKWADRYWYAVHKKGQGAFDNARQVNPCKAPNKCKNQPPPIPTGGWDLINSYSHFYNR